MEIGTHDAKPWMADGVVPPQLGCAVVGGSLPAVGMAAARARHTSGSATGWSEWLPTTN
jgi:hypothetical protein